MWCDLVNVLRWLISCVEWLQNSISSKESPCNSTWIYDFDISFTIIHDEMTKSEVCWSFIHLVLISLLKALILFVDVMWFGKCLTLTNLMCWQDPKDQRYKPCLLIWAMKTITFNHKYLFHKRFEVIIMFP
jgi:hypothetical protein